MDCTPDTDLIGLFPEGCTITVGDCTVKTGRKAAPFNRYRNFAARGTSRFANGLPRNGKLT